MSLQSQRQNLVQDSSQLLENQITQEYTHDTTDDFDYFAQDDNTGDNSGENSDDV